MIVFLHSHFHHEMLSLCCIGHAGYAGMNNFVISACVGGDVTINCDAIANPPPQWRINEELYDRFNNGDLPQGHSIADIRQLRITGVLQEHNGYTYQCFNPAFIPIQRGNNYTLSIDDQGTLVVCISYNGVRHKSVMSPINTVRDL